MTSFPENFFDGMSREAYNDVIADPEGPPSLYVDAPSRPTVERSEVQGSIVDDGTPKGKAMKAALRAGAAVARLQAKTPTDLL
jgi:hypothetical protein